MTECGLVIGHPTVDEESCVGELLYCVDPYIYPALFGSVEVARLLMPPLMHLAHSPFAPDHVWIARFESKVVGMMVAYLRPVDGRPDFSKIDGECYGAPVSFADVCERYLAGLLDETQSGEAYIACLATDAARQGRGVATALLKTCITEARGHAVGLDVVANNKRAMSLYERLGFVVVGEGTGYSYHEAPPRVFRMRRAARDE